ELDRRIVTAAVEQMSERQLAHLRSRGFHQFLVAVPERRAPQPGHALDVALALAVVDEHALAALDHQWPGLPEGVEVGVGMNERLDIAHGEIAERAHDDPLGGRLIKVPRAAAPPPGAGAAAESPARAHPTGTAC